MTTMGTSLTRARLPANAQVQTIGFLSQLRSHKIYGPFIVIGPLSTLPNWVSEFQRWCPDQPALLYHGTKQERADLRQKHLSGA
jgi:ATP-dependent DNA helicase